jgi:hypothetical protein
MRLDHSNEFSLHPSILTPQIDFQSDQIDTQAFSYSTFKKTEQIGTMIPCGARSRSRDNMYL